MNLFPAGSLRLMLLCLLPAVPVYIWYAVSPGALPVSARNILTFLIIAPVAEELIFRGILLEFLLRRHTFPPFMANIAVSMVFAGVHFALQPDIFRLLVFFPSLILGFHYQRHRALMPVIILHALFNMSVFL